MRKAGIRELKAHLSAYVRRVKGGESVLITERGQAVAELRPIARLRHEPSAEEKIAALAERGELLPAKTPGARPLKGWKGVGLGPGQGQRLLDLVRGERGWPLRTSKRAR
ncbi:MAG: type II toxin-antitoxin system prevent-host-death family antitoxin [Myxococcales bacterium]|nr:type II toxin-antitoxin system prevent-host-death family antitoxin [Myxococcales bacterium]